MKLWADPLTNKSPWIYQVGLTILGIPRLEFLVLMKSQKTGELMDAQKKRQELVLKIQSPMGWQCPRSSLSPPPPLAVVADEIWLAQHSKEL